MKYLVLALFITLISCRRERAEIPFKYAGYETCDTYKIGDILPPDYIHEDYREVINAAGFNEALLTSEGDKDIYNALSYYTVKINP